VARILVLDDDEAGRRLLDLVFHDEGIEDVRYASRGLEALTELQRDPPALLIFDLRLPDGNGLAVYREAKNQGYTGAALALTANSRSDPLVREVQNELGTHGVLLKPYDIDDLMARIHTLLGSASD
jgi:DNA-binding response OmpR family regulator